VSDGGTAAQQLLSDLDGATAAIDEAPWPRTRRTRQLMVVRYLRSRYKPIAATSGSRRYPPTVPTPLRPLTVVWDQTLERYASVEPQHDLAAFNVGVLQALRPRWGDRLRVDTFMYRLLFTRPHERVYEYDALDWVYAEWTQPARVEMALVRRVARRSLDQPGSEAVVTGDFTKPENVLPALEALLWQLAEPQDG
jgi:hypothetical protein